MPTNVIKRLLEENDGKLPAYAWPGGYPIIYLFEDGGIACPECANGGNSAIPRTDPSDAPEDKQWHIIGYDVHWEGEPVMCDNCGAEIKSAYGETDDE
jgi:hypothetical protein